MLAKKNNLIFLVFVLLQNCTSSSEKEPKEPEELIKLKYNITSNKNSKKLADYTFNYGYFDFFSGTTSENFYNNVDEELWKKQLLQSCDAEIFIEKREYEFFNIRKLVPFVLINTILNKKIFANTSNRKEITSSITIINDYDSLREYERIYIAKSGRQKKNIESFIRIDNKWLDISTSSYNFADLEKKSEEELVKLNTKELPMKFRDKIIIIFVQDQYRLYFLEDGTSERFPIHSNELIGILKKSLVPENAKIIIMSYPEISFEPLVHIMDLLKVHGYNSLALAIDSSYFFQDSLYKYNKNIKAKFQRDVNTGLANINRNLERDIINTDLNRGVCRVQPISFAIDSLNSIYILPKHVYVKPIDYELIKHYLIRSIQANYDSLQLKKNWAYCMDLVVCTENAIRE
ncbi:MAG: hypothetical protein LBH25_01540 [Fibromonadaceae bacterium]|jgi:biopolymer transport protein ExbD|nr:hypothetical protein [Fibromonadaceae bacterium]